MLKASYRLLDKTGERGTVTWASWLPLLAEDVKVFGEGRVEEAIEATIRQAAPRGAWNCYRARVENRPQRKKEEKRQESSDWWEEAEAVYNFSRGSPMPELPSLSDPPRPDAPLPPVRCGRAAERLPLRLGHRPRL